MIDYLKRKSPFAKASRDKKVSETQEAEFDKMISLIISKLKEYKFIDDLEFVRFWIEQRTKFKNKPIRVIEFELRQKGISKDLIEEALSKFDEKKDLDLENAKKLAEKKLDFYRSLSSQKRREKVTNYLLRKGFNYDTVKKVLKY